MSPLLLALEESEVGAGPLGLLVLLLMMLATFLLIKNMNGRLKRLPREFPEPEAREGEAPSPPAGSGPA